MTAAAKALLPLMLTSADRTETRIGHADEHLKMDRDKRHFILDALAEGMAAGQFGGLPLTGNAPAALLATLDALDWHPDWRSLACAMPHFPPDFGVSDIRDVTERLGYRSSRVRLCGRDIIDSSATCLILDRKSTLLYTIVRPTSGTPSLRDPSSTISRRLRPRRYYDVIVFDHAAPHAATPHSQGRWSAGIWRRFAPELRLLVGLMFVSNLLAIGASFWIMTIFDKALPANALDTLVFLMIGLAGIFATDLCIRQIRSRVVGQISGRLEYILGTALFARLLSFPLEMVAASPINDQINRLKQFETIRDFFNGSVVAVILELPFLFLLLGVVFLVHPLLGGMAAGLVVVYALIGLLLYPHLKVASAEFTQLRSEYMRLLLETLDRRRHIARAGLADVWAERLDKRNDVAICSRLRLDQLQRILTIVAGSTTPLAVSTIVLTGAVLAMDGVVSGGALVATTILIWRLFAPVQQGLMVATRIPDLARLVSQIDTMMQINQNEISKHARLNQSLEPRLEIEGLFMRYPRSTIPALNGIELVIEPGQFALITGPSGAGKTTLLRAIAGHYAVQSGHIRLGGTNIRQLDVNAVAENIAYVTETPLIFHGTLAQNLLLAAPETGPEQLRAIASELGYLDLIETLPYGFDTRLDFARNNVLTPSLKSMISVSQAFLRGPGLILMDEPTADMSPDAEDHLMKAIAARKGKTTIIMVSHRAHHYGTADLVLRLEGGRQTHFGPPLEKG